MKKYLLGLFAIVLAIGFSAFTAAPKQSAEKAITTYWFFTQDDGTPINSATLQTSDPSDCDNTHLTKICVREYPDFVDLGSGSGPYAPVGTYISQVKKTAVR